jgi:hypothetical protein
MALCKRCGQHTEADAEFCDACGGYSERAAYVSVGRSHASPAANGDYRPDSSTYQPAGSGYPDGGYSGSGADPDASSYLTSRYAGLPSGSPYRLTGTQPAAGHWGPAQAAYTAEADPARQHFTGAPVSLSARDVLPGAVSLSTEAEPVPDADGYGGPAGHALPAAALPGGDLPRRRARDDDATTASSATGHGTSSFDAFSPAQPSAAAQMTSWPAEDPGDRFQSAERHDQPADYGYRPADSYHQAAGDHYQAAGEHFRPAEDSYRTAEDDARQPDISFGLPGEGIDTAASRYRAADDGYRPPEGADRGPGNGHDPTAGGYPAAVTSSDVPGDSYRPAPGDSRSPDSYRLAEGGYLAAQEASAGPEIRYAPAGDSPPALNDGYGTPSSLATGGQVPRQLSYEQGSAIAPAYQLHDPLDDRYSSGPARTAASPSGQLPEFLAPAAFGGLPDAQPLPAPAAGPGGITARQLSPATGHLPGYRGPDEPGPAEVTMLDGLRPVTGMSASRADLIDADLDAGYLDGSGGPEPAAGSAQSAGKPRRIRRRAQAAATGNDEAGPRLTDASRSAPRPGPARGAPEREVRTQPARRSPLSGRWISLAAAVVVLILAAVTVALALGHHDPAAGRPAPGRSGPASPAASATGAASAPATGNQLVTVSQTASLSPHAVAAVSFLTKYFSAINAHDYNAYQHLFSAELRSGLSQSAFTAGYGTTRDSGIVLRSVSIVGPTEISAVVGFTSHQLAASSPTKTTCTVWSIGLYLIKQGRHYLLQTPPGSYRAAAASCS